MPEANMTADADSSLDAVERAKNLPSEKRNQGIELFINAGKVFENVAPTLEGGEDSTADTLLDFWGWHTKPVGHPVLHHAMQGT
jgi:hypothetical protein